MIHFNPLTNKLKKPHPSVKAGVNTEILWEHVPQKHHMVVSELPGYKCFLMQQQIPHPVMFIESQ
jgi:hypothetical protein